MACTTIELGYIAPAIRSMYYKISISNLLKCMAGIVRQEFYMNTIKKLGYYSNSENGVVISAEGISHCISGGGKGHDTDVPKILIEYD